MTVESNLKIIKEKIAAACQKSGRTTSEINVIAVTKYVSVETTIAAIRAGVTHIGENRDEGFGKKWEELHDKNCVWHFIGSLQSRKVKNIIDKVDYIHSLDRLSLAQEIEKRATQKVKCFVQVNASGEASKHGLKPVEVSPFIHKISECNNIEVVGLMTMAPATDDESVIRHTFQGVKQLQKEVQALGLEYAPCKELSMGMSNDYEIAIEEGATYIRIGTALVGKEY